MRREYKHPNYSEEIKLVNISGLNFVNFAETSTKLKSLSPGIGTFQD